MNGDANDGAPPSRLPENAPYASVTIPIPKAVQYSISLVSSIPDKLALAGRHHLTHVLIVVCAELAFLKCIGCTNKDILLTVFFTCLLGGYACPVWSNLQRMHVRLDDVFWKIEALEQSIKSLESTLIAQAGTEYAPTAVPTPERPVEPPVATNETPHPPSEIPATPGPAIAIENRPPSVLPAVRGPDPNTGIQFEGMDNIIGVSELVLESAVVINNPPSSNPRAPLGPDHDGGVIVEGWDDIIEPSSADTIPATPPVAIKSLHRPTSAVPSMPNNDGGITLEGWDNIIKPSNTDAMPATPPVAIKSLQRPTSPVPSMPNHGGGITLEGWDNIIEPSNAGTIPATPPVAIKSLHRPTSPVPSMSNHGGGITFEGMDNIAADIGAQGGSSKQISTPTQEPTFSRWLPALREITQRIEQFAEGRLERTSLLNQNEPPNTLSLRRCVLRLLMSAASLSPANFTSPVGYLGPPESTPYYPTGDLQDRVIAFTNAMDCFDDLEVYLRGDDGFRIATRLFDLAQALSDLGLHEYALNTSGFALDTLERPYVVTPNNARLHVASVLSLRANILCDLKRNDEARDAADRAMSLCREHQDSQASTGLDFAYTSLNYAVLLSSIGLKDESAAVAFELLEEVDESQPDTKIISVLCKLCLSNMRFGADDGMDLSSAEETIDSTWASSDVTSQAALAGALLNKSKILSSKGQPDSAMSFSIEAVTFLRRMSSTRPVFSLFLAHGLDTHARHLLELKRTGESYSIRRDAVGLWQTLKGPTLPSGAIARPLAWSLVELAKFRHGGRDRDILREDLRNAKLAVDVFRDVEPLDNPGLGEALYLFADRMLELDKNQEAVTYAEESVHYFREAASEDPNFALDLIFSLSLASDCLACTERADYAFEHAKEAVEVHRGRKAAGVADGVYTAHLRKLLTDVVSRARDLDMEFETLSWYKELQTLGGSVDSVPRRSGSSRGKADEFKKQTNYWIDEGTSTPRLDGGSIFPGPVASSSTLSLDKGKGKEVFVPSPEVRSSTPRVDKGKAKEVNAQFEPNSPRYSLADEEIFSPGATAAAAAQRRLAGLGSTGLPQGSGSSGGGRGSPSASLGIGGRTLGSRGSSIGSIGSRSGSPSVGGGTNSGKTDNDNGVTGARSWANGSRSSSSTRTGTWSGTGIQSRLSEDGS